MKLAQSWLPDKGLRVGIVEGNPREAPSLGFAPPALATNFPERNQGFDFGAFLC